MVSACETLIAHAVTARYVAGVFRCAYAVDGGLMALEVCEARELSRGSARWYIARPCSVQGEFVRQVKGLGFEEREKNMGKRHTLNGWYYFCFYSRFSR
jgi:hypothetical protein